MPTPRRASPTRLPVLPALQPAAWLLLLVLLVLVRVLPHATDAGTSFPGYWLVAREVLSGTPVVQLYDHAWLAERLAAHGFVGDRMLGPPTLALTLVPLAWLPYADARLLWLLAMAACTVLGLRLLTRDLPPGPALALAAAFVASQPVAAGIEVGQVYPLFLVLHALASRGWSQGTATAYAPPIALLVLARGWYGVPQSVGALLAGRPRPALAAGALTVVGLLLSVPIVGADAWAFFLTTGLSEAGGEQSALSTAYQTLRSLGLRLTTTALPHAPDPPLPGLGPLPWLLLAGGVLAATVWAGRRQPPGEGPRGFALWTAAAMLLAPVAEDYHMLLAAVPAAALATDPRRRLLLLPALLLLLPAWDFTRSELWGGWRSLAAYPRVWGLLVLWLGLVLPARPSEQRLDPQAQPSHR